MRNTSRFLRLHTEVPMSEPGTTGKGSTVHCVVRCVPDVRATPPVSAPAVCRSALAVRVTS